MKSYTPFYCNKCGNLAAVAVETNMRDSESHDDRTICDIVCHFCLSEEHSLARLMKQTSTPHWIYGIVPAEKAQLYWQRQQDVIDTDRGEREMALHIAENKP